MNVFSKAIFTAPACILAAAAFLHLSGVESPAAQQQAKQAAPVVVAAAATSSAEGSAPITCLLDPKCTGYWSPRSADAGSNEGIYLRFQEPTRFNFIEITVEGDLPESLRLQTFLDARTSPAQSAQDGRVTAKKDDARTTIETGRVAYKQAGVLPDGTKVPARSVYLVSAHEDDRDDSHLPLDYAAKSVFIKLTPEEWEEKTHRPPKITDIRFFAQKEWPGFAEGEKAEEPPMELVLPVFVAATARASSTLEPAFAFDVAKLFDSQPDMAWSTNGKRNNGIGESVTVTFEEEQEVHGLMLWNGYQRSDTHFKANARVKTLSVAGQTVRVKDEQGPQTVMLPKPVKTRELRLTINAVYPGGSYKDVLISELRLLGKDGVMLLPGVPAPVPPAPPFIARVLDKGYAPMLHEVGVFDPTTFESGPDDMYFVSAMRIRSNGSFVIYTEADDSPGRSAVVEGNWEAQPDGTVLLFGKKYVTPLWGNSDGYLATKAATNEKPLPAPRIFKSVMTIAPFAELSPARQENAVHHILRARWAAGRNPAAVAAAPGEKVPLPSDTGPLGIITTLPQESGEVLALGGPTLEEAVKNITARLREINPLTVSSDVYTEILLPLNALHGQ